MDAITTPPAPVNEPNLPYAPNSPEQTELLTAIAELKNQRELPAVIGGERRMPGGQPFNVVSPHRHSRVLGVSGHGNQADARAAIDAALGAAAEWRALSFDDRAAVILRAADLLAGPWRARLNAATMLGQAKSIQQAEIDACCELADFWRFNVHFARQVLGEQPIVNPRGQWNRTDHRPLEGFVYAVTPFNFTAIAGNLPTVPALMGNVVLWKPSPTQQLAASLTMELLEEAGMPPGVINMIPGQGPEISEIALADPNLAGVHFTGSTATFQKLWSTVGANISSYRSYPRIVGETGGKDFLVVHPSANASMLPTALVRGAYEYSGQKCSAASRAYIPASIWSQIRDEVVALTDGLKVGDVEDFSNFTSAVIDDRAFAKNKAAIDRAHATSGINVLAGGTCDDSEGYYIRPTLVTADDPGDEVFSKEYFGPFLAVHVYDDSRADAFDDVLHAADTASAYALTGSIIANDRRAVAKATEALRFTAGNFYINDKPTGSVVGQQPFGGARASGTNDKAGSAANVMRWTSPRSIKETFVAPLDHRYPHQG